MPEYNYKPKVLIAALDWGLGHASRMIPIIDYFKSINYNVAIASSGAAFTLLRNRFPDLQSYELPSYKIVYKHKSMLWEMTRQLPKIIKASKEENKALSIILSKYKADLIISDNRYGIYNENIPSVFVTHQLQILAPNYLSFANPLLQILHFKFLSNFTQILVPDFYGINSLAGKLSNIKNIPAKVKYIGPISRFHDVELKNNARKANSDKSILVLLSGPEPARSNFEKKLLPQLEKYPGKSVVLRGLPDEINTLKSNRVVVYNHLEDIALLPLIADADVIISRSGYSTIMDMYYLNKKCILIPTSGQTEQEYLAKELMAKGIIYSQSEDDFCLITALDKVKNILGFRNTIPHSYGELEKALAQFNLL